MRWSKTVHIMICFYAACCLSTVSAASEKGEGDMPRPAAEVSEPEIRIGDRVELRVTMPAEDAAEIRFPEKPANTGEFSFYGSKKAGSVFAGRRGRIYTLGIYTTGTHVIPPVEVSYRKKGEQDWRSALSNQVPVEVKSVINREDKDIRGLKGLFPYQGAGQYWALFLFSAAAAVIVALILWRRSRVGPSLSVRERLTPYQAATRRLRALEKERLQDRGLVKQYYSRLSGIVRAYIEDRFSVRAPEMTTEEFMEQARASRELDNTQKHLLNEFLVHCDMVKFARYGPTPEEMRKSFSSAENFIEQTRAGEEDTEDEA
ncbi:MAG: hypothetical protein GF392_05120 [Candidatus Omnitrophica bacterium]|nr:hypothetical protein [Candidatus Omnitrophota bacterium]